MSQSSHADPFAPLVPQRSSERVADAISRTILDGTFQPGDVLPPERTLAQRFQVTRNTVREALRLLEQLRLVRIRQGSGVTVQDYVATAGVEFLGALLRADALGGRAMQDVWEARAVLGQAMFSHAAEQFDGSHAPELAAAVEAFAAEAEAAEPNSAKLQELEFDVHAALLRGAGNQAFSFLHNSLRHIYQPVAHLFVGVVAQPRRLAAEYRRGVAALARNDRKTAKKAFCASLTLRPPTPPSRSKSRRKR